MTYIPVYTLHEMRQMVAPEEMPQQPVIICTGCAHEIPAPRGGGEGVVPGLREANADRVHQPGPTGHKGNLEGVN